MSEQATARDARKLRRVGPPQIIDVLGPSNAHRHAHRNTSPTVCFNSCPCKSDFNRGASRIRYRLPRGRRLGIGGHRGPFVGSRSFTRRRIARLRAATTAETGPIVVGCAPADSGDRKLKICCGPAASRARFYENDDEGSTPSPPKWRRVLAASSSRTWSISIRCTGTATTLPAMPRTWSASMRG